MSVSYIDTPKIVSKNPPTTPTTSTVINTTSQKENRLKSGPIWIITIIIVLIIVIVTIFFILQLTPKTLIVPNSPNNKIYNLNTLLDLAPNGQCCFLNSSSITSTTSYIYDPVGDNTYSTNPSNPLQVCSSLSGQAFTDCVNSISNSDGTQKPTAHRGIILYYLYTPGAANGTCTGTPNFGLCPSL